jgi:hypothetical protein
MSDSTGAQQSTTPRLSSSHSFRKAFAFGAIWWIVMSLIASANSRSHRLGFIFGYLLAPTIIATAIAGAAGRRLVRTWMVWLRIIAVFLVTWLAISLLAVIGQIVGRP